jgi:hypothetical protein
MLFIYVTAQDQIKMLTKMGKINGATAKATAKSKCFWHVLLSWFTLNINLLKDKKHLISTTIWSFHNWIVTFKTIK